MKTLKSQQGWRIVFSIAFFPIAAAVLFLFKLTKSRRTFYAQIERLCFQTASTQSGRSFGPTGQALLPQFGPWSRQRYLEFLCDIRSGR